MFTRIVRFLFVLFLAFGTTGLMPGVAAAADAPLAAQEIRGYIQTFPVGLIGQWKVSGNTYKATATTRFEQNNGQFQIGACVNINYKVTATGQKKATSISTRAAADCVQDQSTTGTIDSFPIALIGTWKIGKVKYQADANTQFNQENGQFAVGGCVEVRFFAQSTQNLATRIETVPAFNCR